MDYYGPMSIFKRFPLVLMFVCALAAHAQTPVSEHEATDNSALNGELFYQLLLGELNAQQGEPGAGFSLILDAARKTGDPRLYQRAVNIALQARSGDSALLAARAWKQALPASREANRYVLQLLIGMNRVGETLDPLRRELATASPEERLTFISTLARDYSRASDRKLVAFTVERALGDYLESAPVNVVAWSAIGHVRLDASNFEGALEAAQKAQALDLQSAEPAMLGVRIMASKNPMPDAEAVVTKYLDGNAKPEVRLGYIRVLLNAQRYASAQTQLTQLTSNQPDFADAWLIQGALDLQNNKLDAAESALLRYVELALAQAQATELTTSNPGLTRSYTFLSQVAEKKGDFARADEWLARIDNPEEALNVQLLRAGLLARRGRVDQALDLIREQPEQTPADGRLKITAEVQLLRESNRYQEAYALLARATGERPDDLDLLYDMAMVAEKLDKLQEMEDLLRRVIAAKPEHPHAYNALGYSLAERGIRLPEAKELILKALEYAAEDPFITDSLGWVEFRSGNLTEAKRILQGAFKTRPDAEIAAHLGEVLWAMGLRDEATKVWQEGLAINRQNETLLKTLERLNVKL